MNAERALSRFQAPDELGAQERAWGVVRAAHQQRAPRRALGRALRRPLGVGLTSLAAAGLVALSPAGATVGRLVDRALGVHDAASAMVPLPTGGRLLVSGSSGTWIVSADGSARRIGPWQGASWSPHGLYLAVAAHGRLTAISTRGILQWQLHEPAVSDPRWYPPSGYRVAYLSRGELRLVAGNGTGDRVLATGVARVAPAWRPAHPYQLAYVTVGGRLVVRDGASGAKLWSADPHARIVQLGWSADGRRLLAGSSAALFLYTAAGRLVARLAPGGGAIGAAALSPNGRDVALVTRGRGGGVTVYTGTGHDLVGRRVLAGPGLGQVVFSPDGRWLLASWPAANQWVFVHVSGRPQIAAVSRIAEQFSTRLPGGPFPRVDGWCCSAPGPSR
ncbi:MAG: hypothetical protein KGL16_00065 [Acidobacteriota bacterium]|nr:hypothetical protein [Acidobacteriota bacterium]